MSVAVASLIPVIASMAMAWLTPPRAEPIRVAELVHTLSSREKPAADRLAAEEELKQHHPKVVLPALLEEIEEAESRGDFAVPGYAIPKPGANDERPSVALHRLWNRIFEVDWHIEMMRLDDYPLPGVCIEYIGPNWKRTAIGETLADLLTDSMSRETRRRLVLGELRRYYTAEAERPLAAIFHNERDFDQVIAAEILLKHEPAKYASVVIDRVADTKRAAASRHLYLGALVPSAMGALKPTDRRKLTRAGFALLAENRSYFTACRLEHLVGITFTPDQKLPKYQGEHGLTDAFFADTVSNALAWWADHRAKYE